jgi:hypothetical protein
VAVVEPLEDGGVRHAWLVGRTSVPGVLGVLGRRRAAGGEHRLVEVLHVTVPQPPAVSAIVIGNAVASRPIRRLPPHCMPRSDCGQPAGERAERTVTAN